MHFRFLRAAAVLLLTTQAPAYRLPEAEFRLPALLFHGPEGPPFPAASERHFPARSLCLPDRPFHFRRKLLLHPQLLPWLHPARPYHGRRFLPVCPVLPVPQFLCPEAPGRLLPLTQPFRQGPNFPHPWRSCRRKANFPASRVRPRCLKTC